MVSLHCNPRPAFWATSTPSMQDVPLLCSRMLLPESSWHFCQYTCVFILRPPTELGTFVGIRSVLKGHRADLLNEKGGK